MGLVSWGGITLWSALIMLLNVMWSLFLRLLVGDNPFTWSLFTLGIRLYTSRIDLKGLLSTNKRNSPYLSRSGGKSSTYTPSNYPTQIPRTKLLPRNSTTLTSPQSTRFSSSTSKGACSRSLWLFCKSDMPWRKGRNRQRRRKFSRFMRNDGSIFWHFCKCWTNLRKVRGLSNCRVIKIRQILKKFSKSLIEEQSMSRKLHC